MLVLALYHGLLLRKGMDAGEKPKGRGVFHIACIWGDIATALSTASFMQPHYSFTTLLLIWYPFQGMKSKASHANTLKRWQLASVYLYECASMIEEPIELPLEYLRGINHGHGQTMKIDLVGPNTGNLSTVFLIRLVGCVQD